MSCSRHHRDTETAHAEGCERRQRAQPQLPSSLLRCTETGLGYQLHHDDAATRLIGPTDFQTLARVL